MSHLFVTSILYEKGCVYVESKPLLLVKSPDDVRSLPQSVVISKIVEAEQQSLEAVEEIEKAITNSLEDNILVKQCHFLARPFQQKVYQPLVIKLKNDEVLTGKIVSFDGQHVGIMHDETQLVVAVDQIEGLYWQNKPFPVH